MVCPLCGVESEAPDDVCSACGADLSLSSSPTAGTAGVAALDTTFAPGAAFGGRFTIVELVGQGGMGQVYKAIDTQLGEPVALKLVRAGTPEAKGLQRFRRELTIARQVSHVNVCRVHDIGESEGIHFISMEFVEGQTLQEWTRAVGKLSPPQAISVARQVCAGLAAIHAASIVHRDLKPSNIMLDKTGRAVIMDFGVAYQTDSDQITAEGEVLGTLAYLSPEQARGDKKLDHRSDIYALGLVIFEMLTGARPPADGNSLPMGLRDRTQVCRAPSSLAPEIPDPLDGIVLRCVEHKQSNRYGSAAEIDHALEQVQENLDTQPRSALPPAAPPRGAWKVLVSFAAVVIVAAAAMYQLLPSPPQGPARIAALPLAYVGPASTQYIVNTLPVVMLKELSAAEGVETAPFPSSRRFAPDEDPLAVARALDVDWVLFGSINVDGQAYETTLNLWSTRDAEIAWTETFEGAVAEHLDIARSASGELLGALGHGRSERSGGRDSAAMSAYAEGLVLLEGWDVEQNAAGAIDAFSRAIAIDGDFADAHAGLARALWFQYRNTFEGATFDRALQEANRAVELAPGLPEARLALGIIQLGRGRSAAAAAAFEATLEMAPADDAVCRRIGDAYAALDRPEDAAAYYERAIELRPEFWENHNSKGNFHLDNGEFAAAAQHFEKVMELRPESDVGYTNLGATHIVMGNFVEAGPLLEASIAIHPTAHAYNNLGFVRYSMHQFEEAERQFRRATELAPEDPFPWTGVGDANRQLGRDAEARQAYLQAVELFGEMLRVNASDADVEALMATAQAGLGRCAEAAESAATATSADEDNFDAHYYAAVAYAICGDLDAAERHTLRAIDGGYAMDVGTNPDLRPLLERPAIAERLR